MHSTSTPLPLQTWRNEIDQIDAVILEQIAKRISIVKKVGEYKKEDNLPFFDEKRMNEVLQQKTKMAQEKNLDPELIKNIFKLLHDYSLALEEQL